MSKARNGQACIISIPVFEEGTNLDPLVGYDVDKSNLSEMWHTMGFDVKYPVTHNTACLTAQACASSI